MLRYRSTAARRREARARRAPRRTRSARAPALAPRGPLPGRSRSAAVDPRWTLESRRGHNPGRGENPPRADWRSARHAERCARHRESLTPPRSFAIHPHESRETDRSLPPRTPRTPRTLFVSRRAARAPAAVVDAAPEMPRGGGGDKKPGKLKKKENAMDARNAVDAMDADDPSLVSHEGGKTLGERALDAERGHARNRKKRLSSASTPTPPRVWIDRFAKLSATGKNRPRRIRSPRSSRRRSRRRTGL